jgi:hypothetical protein
VTCHSAGFWPWVETSMLPQVDGLCNDPSEP